MSNGSVTPSWTEKWWRRRQYWPTCAHWLVFNDRHNFGHSIQTRVITETTVYYVGDSRRPCVHAEKQASSMKKYINFREFNVHFRFWRLNAPQARHSGLSPTQTRSPIGRWFIIDRQTARSDPATRLPGCNYLTPGSETIAACRQWPSAISRARGRSTPPRRGLRS